MEMVNNNLIDLDNLIVNNFTRLYEIICFCTYTSYKEVIIMEVNELINLIVNNGFPVAVSAYLLIRLEKQINCLSSSINKLNTIISTKLGVVIDNNNDDSDKVA